MSIRTMKQAWNSALSVLLVAAPLYAATQSAESVLKDMKMALEPARPSIRTMTFTVHSASFDENTTFVVRQARRSLPNGADSITVVISPESLKDVTLLVQERKGTANLLYVYYPALKRARRFTGVGAFEPFLGTDFAYADLGPVDVRDHTLKLLGAKEHDGAKAYELQETPKNRSYYTRIVNWIDTSTRLPLVREYFDVGNVLWRKQTYEDVATIGGVPTPMKVKIENVQSGDWSQFEVSGLHYDVQLPEAVFDPQAIAKASSSPLWSVK